MMMMMLDVVALSEIFLLIYNRIRVTRFQQSDTRFLYRVISQLTSETVRGTPTYFIAVPALCALCYRPTRRLVVGLRVTCNRVPFITRFVHIHSRTHW